jgi:EAL domain-containing protein (putative c-di-GMP-specific phosphodiesterase class I)
MAERSIFANLIRQPDGAVSTAYGPYLLQSALQPLFSETEDGALKIEAFEGLIRASRNAEPCPPAEFFSLVEEEDRATIDSLCRSLHILNAGALGRRDTLLIVNFHPGLFMTPHAMRHEVDRIRIAAHEAGLPPGRIACEVREGRDDDPEVLTRFTAQLHEHGFLVAIDEYVGDDRDLDRLARLKPDLVKFDSSWVRRFAENSAGLALLRVVVGQFMRDGIRPVFCGIEDQDQIELCRTVGVRLMQGYLLARPEIAPTSFNRRFPESEASGEPSVAQVESGLQPAPPTVETRSLRPARQFGRRGL